MASPKITLSSAGMLAMLNSSTIRSAVNSAAQDVAGNLAGTMAHDGPVDVLVDEYTTDRAVAGVTLAHAAGIALEAKYGLLTGAASAAGLQLGGKKK